jgi:hypothetical protein
VRAYAYARANIPLFTEKCKYSAEKKLIKKAASNTPQATGRHAKKKAASNMQQAAGRQAKKGTRDMEQGTRKNT